MYFSWENLVQIYRVSHHKSCKCPNTSVVGRDLEETKGSDFNKGSLWLRGMGGVGDLGGKREDGDTDTAEVPGEYSP